ncbi:MAG: outer membrane lipoprotein carrier protein LolA [Candidatus Omnitrophica bacterium]|nr:outer membrane lipoprotein carrier protein LolA [Candidatus Omnitrophota bacterium]
MKILRASVLFLCLSGLAFAEETGLPKEAQELLTKAADLESYRVQFTLEANEEAGEPVHLAGTLQFQRPNRRRLEIREGNSPEVAQRVVCDGQTEWQQYTKANVVYRAKSPEETPGPHRPFSEVKPETLRLVQQSGQGRDDRFRFEADPLPSIVEGSPVPIKTLRVEVGKKDGLIRELKLLDTQGREVLTQEYSQVEVNVPIPEETFTFTPPDGTQVIDLDKPQGS